MFQKIEQTMESLILDIKIYNDISDYQIKHYCKLLVRIEYL